MNPAEMSTSELLTEWLHLQMVKRNILHWNQVIDEQHVAAVEAEINRRIPKTGAA